MIKNEFDLQVMIANYLITNHPDIIFRSDLAGIKLSKGYATKLSQIQMPNFKHPDVFIAAPRGLYAGLYIELKLTPAKLYRKDGSFLMTAHIQAQLSALERLRAAGYRAEFSVGLMATRNLIDEYLSL